jgi:hypothetical protein
MTAEERGAAFGGGVVAWAATAYGAVKLAQFFGNQAARTAEGVIAEELGVSVPQTAGVETPVTLTVKGNPVRYDLTSLYHYTDEAGMSGIVDSGELRPSLWYAGTKDVRYGNGQYLSDIVPGTKTPAELSRAFLRVPFSRPAFYALCSGGRDRIASDRGTTRSFRGAQQHAAGRGWSNHQQREGSNAMKYIVVKWKHQNPNEPALLYSELDEAGWEIRKVELFADGRSGWADRSEEHGGTGLGIEPLPSLKQIASDPQFEPAEITREQFEQVWSKRHGS